MNLLKKTWHTLSSIWHIYVHKGGSTYAEEQRLLHTYYNDNKTCRNVAKGVVVMIDGRTVHGGLSDRIRGIASIYGFCKAHHVPFHVYYKFPFKLEDYLQPNTINWTISEEQISYNSQQAAPVLLMLHLLPSKLHKAYLKYRIKHANGKQLHVYTNTIIDEVHYAENFQSLFRPVDVLRETVEIQRKILGEHYVAVTLRFQQLLDDFKEGDYLTLAPESREKLIVRCIEKIRDLHNERHPHSVILVTSDSSTFLARAVEALPFVRTISGKVVHMDYTLNAPYEVYLKSFVDMLTLSEADKIYLLRTDEMYKSGFAYRAAAIHRKPYEYINF